MEPRGPRPPPKSRRPPRPPAPRPPLPPRPGPTPLLLLLLGVGVAAAVPLLGRCWAGERVAEAFHLHQPCHRYSMPRSAICATAVSTLYCKTGLSSILISVQLSAVRGRHAVQILFNLTRSQLCKGTQQAC